MNLHIEHLNESFVRLNCEPSVLFELSDVFTFTVPNYRFMPAYKDGIWDGMIRLINTRNATAPKGLVPKIIDVVDDKGYGLSVDKQITKPFAEQIEFDWASYNLPFEPNDYQVEAVARCLKKKRQIILSSTGSGKSLIVYALARALAARGHAILIVVPSVSLVEQMAGDFDDYGKDDPTWEGSDAVVHKVHSGTKPETEKRIVISTWQSIYKKGQKFFERFSAVFADEVHKFDAKCAKGIMEKCVNGFYRFGFSGTLDDSQTHEMNLEALFGPIHQVSETKDLMDRGILSKLAVRPIVLAHSERSVKGMGRATYQQEMDFIATHSGRNRFIANIAAASEGNTLVMVQYVEKHGKPLEEELNSVCEGKEVFFVYGGTGSEQREKVRKLCSNQNNIVILATYQVFQEGVNIKSLENVILASPTKSKVRVLQSIGRSLRKSDGKEKATVVDLADDLRGGRKTMNHTLKHYLRRHELYIKEGFDVKVQKVSL